MSPFVRLLLAVPIIGLAATDHTMAADDAARYNQIHFQVERSRPVENDRMQAVLSVTVEDENAVRLADQINRTTAWALQTAKAQRKVEIRTASYQTYPVYDKNKIRRWRGTQELVLEGSDFAALGNLIGQLQERLQVTAINFSLSAAQRAAAEDEMITQALEAFKQRADLVRKQLVAKGYRIVDVFIDTGAGQPVSIVRRATAMATSEAVAPPAVEGGTSTLTVTVRGVIELQ
jgi:predicted secreted protein